MCFAVLEYARSIDDFMAEKKWLAKLPKPLFASYIKKNAPYKQQPLTMLGTQGFRVTLPFLEKNPNDPDLTESVLNQILSELKGQGVCALKVPNAMPYAFDRIIPACSGFYIWPFLLSSALGKLCKMKERSIGQVEILIIDGLPDLTFDILHLLCDNVNYLTVVTEDTDYFDAAADELFEENGMDIQVRRQSAAIEQADIILSATLTSHNLENKFKHGAAYIDLAGNKLITQNLAQIRPDMFVADGFQVRAGSGYMNNVLLETIAVCASADFHTYMFGEYDEDTLYAVLEWVQKQPLQITAFLRNLKQL